MLAQKNGSKVRFDVAFHSRLSNSSRISIKHCHFISFINMILECVSLGFSTCFYFCKSQKPTKEPKSLLLQASFWCSINQNNLYPTLSPAFGKKNYPPLPLEKNISLRSFFSPVRSHRASLLLTEPPRRSSSSLSCPAVAAPPPHRRGCPHPPRLRLHLPLLPLLLLLAELPRRRRSSFSQPRLSPTPPPPSAAAPPPRRAAPLPRLLLAAAAVPAVPVPDSTTSFRRCRRSSRTRREYIKRRRWRCEEKTSAPLLR